MESIKVGKSFMPSVGLGLWKVDQSEVAGLVVDAVGRGYRHLDSAADYANEAQAGEGISEVLGIGPAHEDVRAAMLNEGWETKCAALYDIYQKMMR